MAALFTRMSMRPSSRVTLVHHGLDLLAPSHVADDRDDGGTNRARHFFQRVRLAPADHHLRAFPRENVSAMARPMPRLAPVTSATLSFSIRAYLDALPWHIIDRIDTRGDLNPILPRSGPAKNSTARALSDYLSKKPA